MRLIYFIAIVVASVVLAWWLVVLLWVLYALMFRAYELIALGILLDAYFGYVLPWHVFYTVAATLVCIGASVLKPRMMFYDAS